MKFIISLLLCFFAMVFGQNWNRVRERKVNFVNGQRQARVNYIAESIQASSGTFDRDGVPGTGVGGRYYNRRAYDYYPGNYGYQNYY